MRCAGFRRQLEVAAALCSIVSRAAKFARTPLYWAYGWACFLAFVAAECLLIYGLCRWTGAL
jgi:hypothetical protein